MKSNTKAKTVLVTVFANIVTLCTYFAVSVLFFTCLFLIPGLDIPQASRYALSALAGTFFVALIAVVRACGLALLNHIKTSAKAISNKEATLVDIVSAVTNIIAVGTVLIVLTTILLL